MSNVAWSEASPSVLGFAENLIRNFHPHLGSARIAFVFREKAQKLGSRLILGQCSKVPAKFQPYLEFDYLIWLSEEDYLLMDDLQREALIDHELCHCKYNNMTGSWGIRPHDIQEFADVISRHGIWSPDIRRVKNAISVYENQTLPGLLERALEGKGKVEAIKGAELSRAAQALGD